MINPRDWNGHVPDTETAERTLGATWEGSEIPPTPDYATLQKQVEQLEEIARTALDTLNTVLTKLEKSERRAKGYDAVAFETATGILNALKEIR